MPAGYLLPSARHPFLLHPRKKNIFSVTVSFYSKNITIFAAVKNRCIYDEE